MLGSLRSTENRGRKPHDPTGEAAPIETNDLTEVRIDLDRLRQNLRLFASRVGPDRDVMPIVKSNAYGHGIELVARALLDEGVRWLGVNSADEGLRLRALSDEVRVLVLGYVPPSLYEALVRARVEIVLTNPGEIPLLDAAALAAGQRARVHLKVETGTHRRGVTPTEFREAADRANGCAALEWVGLATHFANIEDTVNHDYANLQLTRFREADEALRELGFAFTHRHIACTAATLLFPETHYNLARVGIGLYGLWPSRETRLSLRFADADAPELAPVLSWHTTIVQVKPVPAGAYVGYGRTFRAATDGKMAVIPVGYYEGYDRHLSNTAHVLVHGQRAPVRGRVCMNMTIVDVSHIPGAAVGDEVTLLGRQGDEEVTADDMAAWAETINYEIVTRIHPSLPRRALSREALMNVAQPSGRLLG